MDDRIDKLPQWAQTEIKRLTGNLEGAYKTIKAMGEKTGPVTINAYSDVDSFGMPARTAIEFQIGEHEHETITVMIREPGVLDINASFGRLYVLPRAANSIHIKSER